ncbi:MAG: hypothetical protein OXD50_07460 [Chloroflexi bacterium]|nr:hypothetical protein [Chloroflexota bacterium]
MKSVRGWSRCCLGRASTSRFPTARCSLPREFGNQHTIYVRPRPLGLGQRAGTGGASTEAGVVVESYMHTLSLDSTIIHLHMHGTGARRTGDVMQSATLWAV